MYKSTCSHADEYFVEKGGWNSFIRFQNLTKNAVFYKKNRLVGVTGFL